MKKSTSLLAMCMLLSSTASFPQAGSLDSTFGGDGKVNTAIGFNSFGKGIVIQKDGNLLMAGESKRSGFGQYDFTLMRYKPNGYPDSSFGIDGTVITDFGYYSNAYSIALQPDGKSVAAGGYNNGVNYDFALTRYKLNGNLDSSFGMNGKVITDFGSYELGQSVFIQDDQKIVVAGTSTGLDHDFALARYRQNGQIDSTFGVNGKVIADFGFDDIFTSAALQTDGRMVLAGYFLKGFYYNLEMARFKQDGSLDSSFGKDGKIITDLNYSELIYSVLIQSDRKIVVAGGYSGSGNGVFLARYKSNGRPDSSFGLNGAVFTNFTDIVNGSSAAIQTDGKIVVGGFSQESSYAHFAIMRYYQDGRLDSSFGTNGITITDLGNEYDYDECNSVAIQPDGKIVAAGSSASFENVGSSFALARYMGDTILPSISIANKSTGEGNTSTKNISLQVSLNKPSDQTVWVKYKSIDGTAVSPDDYLSTKGMLTFLPGDTIEKIKIVIVGDISAEKTEKLIIRLLKPVNAGLGDSIGIVTIFDDDTAAPVVAVENEIARMHPVRFSITLSPNPVKDILHMKGLSSNSTKTISIVDIKGKLLQQITTANSVYSFNVKQLYAGVYFVRIAEGEKITTLKFVKE